MIAKAAAVNSMTQGHAVGWLTVRCRKLLFLYFIAILQEQGEIEDR